MPRTVQYTGVRPTEPDPPLICRLGLHDWSSWILAHEGHCAGNRDFTEHRVSKCYRCQRRRYRITVTEE